MEFLKRKFQLVIIDNQIVKKMKKLIPFLLFVILSSPVGGWGAFAQIPTLLKDINTVGNAQLNGFKMSNNILFFSHDDEVHGYELWRSDGTAAGTYMVKDISVGNQSSDVSNMFDFNGVLYFSASTVANGRELWKSDGTANGTVMVKDIIVGNENSSPYDFTACGNYLLFKTANYNTQTYGLYQTNGTITTLLFNSNSQGVKEIVSIGVIFSQQIFFTATNSSGTQSGIWQAGYSVFPTLGTISTPTLIAGTTGAVGLTTFSKTSPFEISLYYRNAIFDLRKYDIINSTTSIIKAFLLANTSIYPSKMFVFNNNLYLTGFSNANGFELWKSDGTAAGTTLLKNINTNDVTGYGSSPTDYIVCNNELFFRANDGTLGTELWKTNGTAAGTVLANDITVGNAGSYLLKIKTDGTNLYFNVLNYTISSNEISIYRYNASSNTLTLLKNFPNLPNYNTADGEMLNATYFFVGYDVNAGFELWKTDGTVANTAIVKDISQGNASINHILSIGANTFFSPDEGYVKGTQLWKTDGTSAGTVSLKTINPNGHSYPANFTNLNGTLMFTANDGTNINLWKSDGTTNGTVKVNAQVSLQGNSNLSNVNGTLYFSASNTYDLNNVPYNFELWKSDGTSAGTVLIKDINTTAGNESYPSGFTFFNGFTYFSADDGVNGNELWRTDGTTVGTTLVKDIYAGISGGSPYELTVSNNKLCFAAYTAAGYELWVSDGTTNGTFMVKDIYAGTNNGSPEDLVTNGTKLYFAADDGNGRVLWESNGTSIGTKRVTNLNPEGLTGRNPQNLTFVGNILYFSATLPGLNPAGSTGRELWSYNTTNSYLTFIKNINSIPGEGSISNNYTDKFQVLAGNVFFPANDGRHGTELWRSNGTEAGTYMVDDLFLNNDDGLAYYSRIYANTGANVLYFQATNGQNGRELWSFPYCPSTLNINTTVATNTQKQQASNTLTSSSNIANTDFTHDNLTVIYTAGNSITLQPGFQVTGRQFSAGPAISVRETFFRADIGGCN